MVGLLNAPRGTRLHQRLKKENRLLETMSGDNTDFSINFIPKMNYETLINGYRHVLNTIYSPRQYYERVRAFLREYKPQKATRTRLSQLKFQYVIAFFKSIWFLGVKEKGRGYYWKLLVSTLFRHPRLFHLSVIFSVYGFHFRKIVEKFGSIPAQDASASGQKGT
jgi:hypothetical protein